MTPIIKLVRNDLGPSVRRYATEMKKGLREAVKQTAAGITRRVIDITPPASQGVTGADAYRAGRLKIANQMNSVLAPVKIKGRRKITTVFGHKLKRPVYVPTREKYPAVDVAYRARTKIAASGFGIRAQAGGPKAYVDVRKFQAVLKARQERVGALAAGFAGAAQALDVPLQNWVSRHGTSGGRVQIDTAGDRMRVVVENFGNGAPAPIVGELARRIDYAVQYQRSAMERAIVGYHNRTKQQLGIKG